MTRKVDNILPRTAGEDILEFGARVAKALDLEEVEIQPHPEGGFALVLGRELTLDEFIRLQDCGIPFRVVLEFK